MVSTSPHGAEDVLSEKHTMVMDSGDVGHSLQLEITEFCCSLGCTRQSVDQDYG
jgi:hypothetical protein